MHIIYRKDKFHMKLIYIFTIILGYIFFKDEIYNEILIGILTFISIIFVFSITVICNYGNKHKKVLSENIDKKIGKEQTYLDTLTKYFKLTVFYLIANMILILILLLIKDDNILSNILKKFLNLDIKIFIFKFAIIPITILNIYFCFLMTQILFPSFITEASHFED